MPILISQDLFTKGTLSVTSHNSNNRVDPESKSKLEGSASVAISDDVKAVLFISLCQGFRHGKLQRFWLLTEKQPRFVLSDAKDLSAEKLISLWEKDGIDKATNKYQSIVSHIINLHKDNPKDQKNQTLIEVVLYAWEKYGIEKATEVYIKLKSLSNVLNLSDIIKA